MPTSTRLLTAERLAESLYLRLSRESVLSADLVKSHIRQTINQALEKCAVIAGDVESEAASLILNPDLDETEKEYYKGRGPASARIAKQIRDLKSAR